MNKITLLMKLFTVFVLLNSVNAENGGVGVQPSASLISGDTSIVSDIKFTDLIKDYVGIHTQLGWDLRERDNLRINIDRPELINTIKMIDGNELSYPERGGLIKTNDVDSILLNDGRSINLVKPSLATLPNEIIFDRNLKTNLFNSFYN